MANNRRGYAIVRDPPKGDILAVRKVANRGRVQIPGTIKRELGVVDGDRVWWIRNLAGEICLTKAVKIE